jgi:hypothetical protein
MIMKSAFVVTALAGVMLGGAAVAPAEEPLTFERGGLPITSHQVQVLGSVGVEEQSACPMLMREGMPASPHQLAVLGQRPPTAH